MVKKEHSLGESTLKKKRLHDQFFISRYLNAQKIGFFNLPSYLVLLQPWVSSRCRNLYMALLSPQTSGTIRVQLMNDLAQNPKSTSNPCLSCQQAVPTKKIL